MIQQTEVMLCYPSLCDAILQSDCHIKVHKQKCMEGFDGSHSVARHYSCRQYTADRTCVLWRSLCPTFAAVACFIDNARWDGVPFLLKAGKALHSKRAEIRVQFRHVPGNLYKNRLGIDLDQATNELVSALLPVPHGHAMSRVINHACLKTASS